jgi:UDP-N-acetylmuramate--alanine ligase
VTYDFPQIGSHNLSNLLAAIAVCEELGCSANELALATAEYTGLKRRFEIVGADKGVTVIDDYAHNPEKIRAALRAAQTFAERVFAIFQPHGFGPTKFMKDELIDVFATVPRPVDEVYLLPIYYAGGTAQKDISSGEIVAAVCNRGAQAYYPADRPTCIDAVRPKVKEGDAILLMGARDPSLPGFAKQLLDAIARGNVPSQRE